MKKKKLLLTVGILIVSLLAGCGKQNEAASAEWESNYYATSQSDSKYYDDCDYGYEYYEESAADTYFSSPTTENQLQDIETSEIIQNQDASSVESSRKLITTVNMDVETDSFDTLTTNVEERTRILGGYVESLSVRTGYDNCKVADYTIRIPENRLEEFLTGVTDEANVISRNRYVEDVTLSYADLQGRKEVLRTEEARLIEMLADAEDIETMIYIESRLSQVQCDLESMESQLRVFDNLVNYSTINLSVSEVKVFTVVEQEEETAWTKMIKGLEKSWNNLVDDLTDFGIGIVVSLPYVLFWCLVIFVIILIIRGMIKGIMKKIAKKKAAKERILKEKSVNVKSVNENSVNENSVNENSVNENSVNENSVNTNFVKANDTGEKAGEEVLNKDSQAADNKIDN